MLSTKILIQTENSALWVVENFSEDYYEILKDVFCYEEPPIKIMGKDCRQRRNVAFYSDESEGYKYSGQTMKSLPLSNVDLFPPLLEEINNSLGTNFNGILVNRYINGEKYLSAHSDDENGLDKNNKMVVGLSYGPGIRKFRIRDKNTKEIILDYDQQPKTLLVMQGEFQKEFTHEIPIQKKIKDERISITFRHHIV
jgi:alkylated DNA repair dioxygenase AlkB